MRTFRLFRLCLKIIKGLPLSGSSWCHLRAAQGRRGRALQSPTSMALLRGVGKSPGRRTGPVGSGSPSVMVLQAFCRRDGADLGDIGAARGLQWTTDTGRVLGAGTRDLHRAGTRDLCRAGTGRVRGAGTGRVRGVGTGSMRGAGTAGSVCGSMATGV